MNGKSNAVTFGEKYAVYEEKKEFFKTEDATVEVTIKLKKNSQNKPRSQKSHLSQVYNVAETMAHRAGSWGDLLLRKKTLAECEASVSNAGDQGQAVPVRSKESHSKKHDPYQVQIKAHPSEESNRKLRAQVDYENAETKTVFHRKKSKYTKLPQTHRNPPYDREREYERNQSKAPNAPCSHHEKYKVQNRVEKIQLQVPQTQETAINKPRCTCPNLRCCEACTCYAKNPNFISTPVANVKDQESQTSVLIQQPTSSTVSQKQTTTTQTTERSPPTKEIEVQVPHSNSTYSRQQQQTQNHYMQGHGHSSVHVKPRHSNSSPNKQTFRRISSSRRSETAITTTTSTNFTRRNKEDAQVQVQVTERERSSSVTGKPRATASALTGTGRVTEDQVDHEAILQNLKKLSDLEIENLKLKKDTEVLLQQVDKAKNERQEYITTIKELYELAEVLRHENVILIGTHEEHRSLQDKLLEAIGENQVLKKHLQELTSKIPPPSSAISAASPATTGQSKENHNQNQSHIKDFWRVRDILKEVKTVIADEINGLQNISLRKSPPKIDDSDILELFEKMAPNSQLNLMTLNDTNGQCDEEVQHILNVNKEADRSDVRSSTQYLDIGGSGQPAGRHFVPSPCSDLSSL